MARTVGQKQFFMMDSGHSEFTDSVAFCVDY